MNGTNGALVAQNRCKACRKRCSTWFCDDICRKNYFVTHTRANYSEDREARCQLLLADGRQLSRADLGTEDRKFDCESYSECLEVAARLCWEGFSCGEKCPRYVAEPMPDTDAAIFAALGNILSRD